MCNNQTDEYHLYRVNLVYAGKDYSCEFYSTAEITPTTNEKVAWDIADDAIKNVLKAIPDREEGIHPHSIVISGEFGVLTVKE